MSAPASEQDKKTGKELEQLLPYSEAKIFRTDKAFIVQDKHDEQWVKVIHFDDVDRIQTEIACRTLEPARVAAMRSMPLPTLLPIAQEEIEEFEKEFEQICIREQEQSEQTGRHSVDIAHISSIRTEDDMPEGLANDQISIEQFIQSHYGHPLTHQETSIHTPSVKTIIPQSSEHGPLSYQQTVLHEDPVLTEDFDNIIKRRKTKKTASLICSATSQFETDSDEDSEEEEEDLPSSFEPSQYEELLFQKRSKPRKTEKQRKQKRRRTPTPSDTEEEDDDDWQMSYEVDILSLIRKSMPQNFLIHTLLTIFLMIVVIMGFFIQINIGFYISAILILWKIGEKTYRDFASFFKNLMEGYVTKTTRRRRFSNTPKPNQEKIYHHDTVRLKPLDGFQILKQPGKVQSKKIKRKLETEPIRVSEARVVKHTDQRNYLIVRFFNTITKYALFDPGSSCCIIHPKFLEQLRNHAEIPTEESKFQIQGIVPGTRKESKELVYLDFQLETGYWLKNIPFLVYASDYDILIGINLIKAQRWANCWRDSDFFIDLGHNQPLVPTYVKTDIKESTSTTAVLVSEVTIYPSDIVPVTFNIPQLRNKTESPFKEHELLIETPEEIGNDNAIEILPSLSRLDKQNVHALIKNNSDEPITLAEGMISVKVSTVPKDREILSVNEFVQARENYGMIPQIITSTCHCEINKHLKPEEEAVKILISDQYGNTSIGNVLNNIPLTDFQTKKLQQGIHLMNKGTNTTKLTPLDTITMLLVMDENNGLGHIQQKDIKNTKRKIEKILSKHKKTPLYFFLNPLTTVSFTTRMVLNDLFRQIPFSFFPVQNQQNHLKCVKPALAMNIPSLLTGISNTKIHIQNGSAIPPENMLRKEHSTPTVIIPFGDARLIMFRHESTLNCHFHIPIQGSAGDLLTESERNHLIHWLLTELKQLRVPLQTEITIDGTNSVTKGPISLKYYQTQIKKIVKEMPFFSDPSVKTTWPHKVPEELPEKVTIQMQDCKCSLCLSNDITNSSKPVLLYKGDINRLIGRHRAFDIKNCDEYSNISSGSRVTSIMKRKIASICDIKEDFDTDQPLDPMELCPEDEMQEYLHSEPFQDFIPDEDENLPPPQKSDPKLFEGHDIEGIPDQFRPGNWRDTDIMTRLDESVPQHIREQFQELLDKHVNTLSYHATDCRPVLLHGKPAVVDVQLKTKKPIFMKPFMVNGAAVEQMDKKLLDLYNKGQITPIESPYNTAVIFTHHNSSQKNIKGIDKLVRLVLDVRVINSLIEEKNRYSYLVRAVDHLLMILSGMKWFTAMDVARAYRALIASAELRRITAFRCPSSRIFPQVTFAFRSACDGLANLPGFYSFLVQEALSNFSRQCTVAHIDDLLVFSKTMEEHLQHIDSVLTDLGKQNFMISAKKLSPFRKNVTFLGHVLDGTHKWIPEERKNYFDSLEPPTTKKELQKLLGLSNYMSFFIDSYSILAGPLFDAIKKKADKAHIRLNDIQMKSFLQLKKAIREAPKLHLLDTTKTLYMECDASLVGVGSILYQEEIDENGKVHRNIIRYGSRRFAITEAMNHNSLEKEAMAIIISAKQHIAYLKACPEVIIKTDLKSLINMLSCYTNADSTLMSRMSFKLFSLPVKWQLQHIPGLDLPFADALSRIHPPYRSLYSDRHLRYPDLKREDIVIPDEWKKPDMILTTTDIMEAIRQNIVFIEKASDNVIEKRLKRLEEEVNMQYSELDEHSRDQLMGSIKNNLARTRDNIMYNKQNKAKVAALTTVPTRTLVTPKFITESQNANPKLHNIITMLRTIPKEKIPVRTLKRFRLLNDSILITRKNKNKTFDHPGNLRIVCDAKMTIQILARIHVTSCHYGMNVLNHVFSNTYKCIEGSTQGYVKLVCSGCRSCRFHRNTQKKVLPEGRIPLPDAPNEIWMLDFMVFKQEQFFNGRKIAAAFNIVDLFSNLLISIPVKDQQASTVIECLKKTFAQFNVPRKIVSDNATALCKNEEVQKFLRNNNIKFITTITAHNSKGNKTERIHKIFRETLQLVQETFRRENQFNMYYSVVQMINSRPLTLALHPNVKEICKQMDTDPGVITPFSLHFGLPPVKHPLIPLENTLDQNDRQNFRLKWQHIIKQHDIMLQRELDERNETFKGKDIAIGDLVLVRNMIAHKEQLKYYKEVYEVIKINKARYFCAPLFTKGAIMEVNGNNLKPYTYDTLYEILPQNIRQLMGENLSPQELKKQAKENPQVTPKDFQNWRQLRPVENMALRNRITPRDKLSEPALSIVETDLFSDTDSSSIFSIPDTIPDFTSELSALLNASGVSQIKTTGKGLVTSPYKITPYKPIHVPSLQKKNKTKSIEDQAITEEDVKSNWKKKKERLAQKEIYLMKTPIKKKPETTTIKTPETPARTEKDINPNQQRDHQQRSQPATPIVQQDIDTFDDISEQQMTPTTPEVKQRRRSRIGQFINDSVDKIRTKLDRSKSRESIDRTPQTPQQDQNQPTPRTSRSPVQRFSNIANRLRDRSKIRKPFRFLDPNYTK